MRDSARIPAVLAAIHNVWKRNPDLRLAQLIVTAASQSGRSVECPELFSLGDEDLIRGLSNYDHRPLPPSRPKEEHPNDRFWSGDHIDGITLTLNQHVRFIQGEHAGREGFVISLEALTPEPTFRVERMDDGFDVVIPQSWLQAVE
ncbi:hypothetical protein CMV30_14965 [Nibricoccus aquaticus]|uniref:Uncharacterized protein n=1 Tax=Nibricoccus aquaticus TaxID=2576891 RepID=A0A290Q927_9BACT|nr:hypothetical protein [Nibricoccus aquaticus]ATC65149.1 hypothetical protein CMV30_14965 [Nibricoccus aquaticus]